MKVIAFLTTVTMAFFTILMGALVYTDIVDKDHGSLSMSLSFLVFFTALLGGAIYLSAVTLPEE